MPRIDIELTSTQPDGSWTWRAAGARQPKGVVAGSVLHEGAKVGDVLRAEADFDLDGINVTSVSAPKAKRAAPETLPVLGSGREEQLVTHSPLSPERGDRDRSRRGDRAGGDRFGGGGGRPGGRSGGPGATRPRATPGPGGPRPAGSGRHDGGARPGAGERTRSERPAGRPDGGRPGPGPEGSARRGEGRVPAGERRGGDRPARERPDRPGGGRPAGPPGRPARPRPKRLQAGRTHRDAVLANLTPEQRAIAEQVMRGGLAGVRAAVDEQNARAREAGDPEIHADALLALAEQLLPVLRAAEWRDRAEAAAASLDELSLRDLRTVVAGADAAGRDDESRALATTLRQGLERRSAAERQSWVEEIEGCLAEGRLVRAVRVSSRPPEQGVRFPPEIASTLAQAAGAAMAPETTPERWLALLEAVVTSPVRRSIQPRGLPTAAGEDLIRIVRQNLSKVPGLAPLVGETPGARPVPPPPPRPRAAAPAPGPPAESTGGATAATDPQPVDEARTEPPGAGPDPDPPPADAPPAAPPAAGGSSPTSDTAPGTQPEPVGGDVAG